MTAEIITTGDLELEAEIRDKDLRLLWANMTQNFYDIGEAAEIVYRKELYKFLRDDEGHPFDTGDDWLLARIPEKGRSTVYRARKMYRELELVPREERRKVKQCNAPILAQLSDVHKKDPEVVKAAQSLPEKDFVEKVKREFPDEHVEVKSPIRLKPSESQRDIIEETIEMAMWVLKSQDGTCDREHALEAILVDWRGMQCSLEMFQHMTNEEAYESQHETTKAMAAKA